MNIARIQTTTVESTAPPAVTAIARRRIEGERLQTWKSLTSAQWELIWERLAFKDIARMSYVSKACAWLAMHPIAARLGFALPHSLGDPFTLQGLCANAKEITERLNYISEIFRNTMSGTEEFLANTVVRVVKGPVPPPGMSNIPNTVCLLENYKFKLTNYLKAIPHHATILNCLMITSRFSLELEEEIIACVKQKYTISSDTICIAFVKGSALMLSTLLEHAPAAPLKTSLREVFSYLVALLTEIPDIEWTEKMAKILLCLERGAPLPSNLFLTISQHYPYAEKCDFASVVGIFDYCYREKRCSLSLDTVLHFQQCFVIGELHWAKIRYVFIDQSQVIPSSFILEVYEQYDTTRALEVVEDLSALLERLPFASTDACLTEAPCMILPFHIMDLLIKTRGKPLDVIVIKFCLKSLHFMRREWGTLRDVALPENVVEREQLREEFFLYRAAVDKNKLNPAVHITLAELAAWMITLFPI